MIMKTGNGLAALAVLLVLAGCGGKANTGEDEKVKTLGTVEVTARLTEVPEGAVFYRELYDYATVLKFEVAAVHRGAVKPGDLLYVAHYNPWKPRAEAADTRAKGIGGSARQFVAGRRYRLALEAPLDDFFMGGVVDKYFGKHGGPIYWAVWTNAAD
jgi:hypothetical protein